MTWQESDALRESLECAIARLDSDRDLALEERTALAAALRESSESLADYERHSRIVREAVRDRNQEFEQKILELSVFKQIGDLIAGSLRYDDLLDRVLDVLVREFRVENSSIMLLDESTGDLRVEAGRGAADLVSRESESPVLRLGEGIAGWVAASKEPLIVSDVTRDVRFKHAIGERPLRGSLVCVPLLADDHVLGVLNLSTSSTGTFVEEHLRILRIVASQIASALVGKELHDELRSLSDRLEDEVRERTQELERRTTDLRRKNEQITELFFSLERAQKELEARNRELVEALTFNDNIVETVHVGIGVVNHEGTVVTWNRAMDSITGGLLPKEEVLGKRLDELPEELRERFTLGRTLLDARTRGRPFIRHDHVVELAEGETLHLNVHHLPLSIATDGHEQVLIVIEDVTANVNLHEQELKSERLAAINETMVSVNHEVNNPLAVILGFTQILLRKSESGMGSQEWREAALRNLRRVESEAIRIREITQKLATLVEPVVTPYPAGEGVRMVDVEQSR